MEMRMLFIGVLLGIAVVGLIVGIARSKECARNYVAEIVTAALSR